MITTYPLTAVCKLFKQGTFLSMSSTFWKIPSILIHIVLCPGPTCVNLSIFGSNMRWPAAAANNFSQYLICPAGHKTWPVYINIGICQTYWNISQLFFLDIWNYIQILMRWAFKVNSWSDGGHTKFLIFIVRLTEIKYLHLLSWTMIVLHNVNIICISLMDWPINSICFLVTWKVVIFLQEISGFWCEF